MLTREGIYASECSPLEGGECKNRTLRFNVIFTVAAVVSQGAGLFIGFAVDFFGPRRSMLAGCLLIASASCMFAFTDDQMDLFPFAYCLYAAGGGLVHLSSFSLSNRFGKKKSMVTGLLVGLFSLSGLMFSAFELLNKVGITRAQLFSGHAIIVVMNAVVTSRLWPNQAFEATGEEGNKSPVLTSNATSLENGQGSRKVNSSARDNHCGSGDGSGSGEALSNAGSPRKVQQTVLAKETRRLRDALSSTEYVGAVAAFSVALLMVRMYQGTCYDQLGRQVGTS